MPLCFVHGFRAFRVHSNNPLEPVPKAIHIPGPTVGGKRAVTFQRVRSMAFVQPRLPPLPAAFLNVHDDSLDSSRVLRRCSSFPGYTPFELDPNFGEASEAEDAAATWPDTDEEGLGRLGAPWSSSTLGPRAEETSEDSCKGGGLLK